METTICEGRYGRTHDPLTFAGRFSGLCPCCARLDENENLRLANEEFGGIEAQYKESEDQLEDIKSKIKELRLYLLARAKQAKTSDIHDLLSYVAQLVGELI